MEEERLGLYALIVQPGKKSVYVPPPEDFQVHLSQASIHPTVRKGTRVGVTVKAQDREPVLLCTLTAGRQDTVALDVFLPEYVEFGIIGDTAVHLVGYYSRNQEFEPDGEDLSMLGMHGGEDSSDEDDEDDVYETDEEDSESSGDDDDEEVDLDGLAVEDMIRGRKRKPQVIIEEADGDEGHKAAAGKKPANGTSQKAMSERQRKLAQAEASDSEEDSDDVDSDDEDDEEDDEASSSGDGDEEMEQEEQVPVAALKQGKAGSKRKAEEAAAAAGATKRAAKADNKPPSAVKSGKAAQAAAVKEEPAAQAAAVKEEPAAKHAGSKQQAKQDTGKQAAKQDKQQTPADNGKQAAKQDKQQTPADNGKQAAKQDKQQTAAAKQSAAASPAAAGSTEVKAGQVPTGKKNVRRFENGFEIHDLSMGRPDGKLAKQGKRVTLKYVGKLKSGKIFDQTKGNKGFTFRLGTGEVIKGWDAGVLGMRVGDKRKLIIPPQMGYGSAGSGPIPPNSTLDFEVELLDVK